MATKSKITKLEVGQKYIRPTSIQIITIVGNLNNLWCIDSGDNQLHGLTWYTEDNFIKQLNDKGFFLDGNS